MDRRNFLYLSGTAPFAISNWKGLSPTDASEFLIALRSANEATVTRLVAAQAMTPDKRSFGSIPNSYGIDTPGGASSMIVNGISAWVSPESKWHQDSFLMERLLLAAEYLLRVQHMDGTIDLYSTNFHSTPDVAFVVEPVALGLYLLPKNESTSALEQRLSDFLIRGGKALSIGGIHTPNHRWVVSMALSRIHSLMPKQSYLDRIDQWLTEGMDIDPDGQFTERSSSVYSPLTDRCLITIARLAGREDLYAHVRKNLEMSMYYFHPNGEVVTEASTRQDQYQIAWPVAYHYPYMYMSRLDKNDQFGAAAHFIREVMETPRLARDYPYLLEDPTLAQPPTKGQFPNNYYKVFRHSQMVRIRDGGMDSTISAQNSTFFTMMKDDVVVQGIRFASAFFGKGQFVGEILKVNGEEVTLRQELEGPYYQPFHPNSISGSGVWEDMPRKERPQSEVQQYAAEVKIKRVGKAFTLEINIDGTAHVPVAIEINLRDGGQLSGSTPTDIEDAHLFTDKEAIYTVGETALKISGGGAEHQWTQLRGALPKLPGISLYVTGYTPFRRVLTLE